MINRDFIPKKEGDLVPWTENFINVANANLATLGLIAGDITSLTTKKNDYVTKLNTAIAKQAESKAATEAKNITKSDLVKNIRQYAKQIQARTMVPNNLKEQLGLKVKDNNPSPINPVPPSDLSAVSTLNGITKIKWNRNNNHPSTIFIVEKKDNNTNEWIIVGNTTKTNFETTSTGPLGTNFYRVKAQKGEMISESSNIVVV